MGKGTGILLDEQTNDLKIAVKAGCPPGGVVLDSFFETCTTGIVARNLGRNYIGIELNPDYEKIAEAHLGDGVIF